MPQIMFHNLNNNIAATQEIADPQREMSDRIFVVTNTIPTPPNRARLE